MSSNTCTAKTGTAALSARGSVLEPNRRVEATNLTGRENPTLIGRLSRVGRRASTARADQLLDLFGLSHAGDRLVRGYSGGIRRRLDLAAALVHRPPVLFLDEPTTGLDPESRFQLWESVRDLARAGTTVLLITQYLEEADALADQVVTVTIADGRVADTGTPGQLKERFGIVVFTLGFAAPSDALTASGLLAAAGYQAEADLAALRVSSDSGSGALPGLLRILDRVPDPVSVAVREPTLDDVFLALTGQVPARQGGTPA